MMLAAGFAAIGGIGAGIFAPFLGFGKGRINQSAVPIDLIRGIQFGQQHGMQIDPDAGLVPELQVISTRLAATTPKFGWQVVPSNTGLEYKQNTGKDFSVIQGLTSGKAETASGRGWQQRLQSLPERIAHELLHGTSSMAGVRSPDHRAAARVPNALKIRIF